MIHSSVTRSRQALLVTAALFSTGGVAIKAVHLPGIQIACLRSGIAAVALFLILPEARRNWSWRVLGMSFSYALTLASFVIANKLTSSANAIFLQETSLVYIIALSGWLLRERMSRADYLFLAPLVAGMGLFFVGSEHSVESAPNPLLGNLVAAASGLFYACLVISMRWLARRGDDDGGTSGSLVMAGLGNLVAFAICLPLAWPLQQGRALDWMVLLYLGVFQIALAYFLMTKALRYLSAVETSLLLLLEPVLNPIWTWLVYRERPGDLSLVGGGLILGATVARTYWSARRERLQNDILKATLQ